MSEKIQPLTKWTRTPMNLARSRFGVNIVPSRYGMFIRVRPSDCVEYMIAVSTTVAAKPQSSQLPIFIDAPLAEARGNKGQETGDSVCRLLRARLAVFPFSS